jgi:hypothetical protein
MADITSQTVGSTTVGANYAKYNIDTGLAGRTLVVKIAKTDITNTELNTIVNAITTGRHSTATSDDAATIVNVGTATGAAFVSGTTDVVYLQVQTTGTFTAQGSAAYGVTGAVTTIEATFVPKL